MNTTWAFWIGLLGAFGIAVSSRRFYLRQNLGRRGARMGGAISPAKAYWLGLVLYCWYLLGTLFVLVRPALGLHLTFLAASVSVGVRAVVEALMLFRYKNWRPAYGIAHNVSMLVLLVGTTVWSLGNQVELRVLDIGALGVWVLSVSMELHHARAFSKIVGAKTTGDSAVWFANADAPDFVQINRTTAKNNLVLTLVALSTLLWMAIG